MKNLSCRLFSSVVILGWIAGATVSRADHRDATNELADPRTNINDVFAFVNQTSGNVVLAMTVNGNTVPEVKPVFAPGCLYQFKIDNTGDFIEDLVIQVFFGNPSGPAFSPTQGFSVIGPIKPPKAGGLNKLAKTTTTAPPITGAVTNSGSEFTSAGNGIKVFCGLRDDPFFFDEVYIRNILRGTISQPVPAQTRSNTPGIDYYAGLNCSGIVIEIPVTLLTGTLANPSGHKLLNIWATTSLPKSVSRSLRASVRGEPLELRESNATTFVQHDRAAFPCVSTVLVAEEDKNAFCAGQPKDDATFFAGPARPLIQKLQLSPTSAGAIAAADHAIAISFPDVLLLDVTSTAGFSSDNGRRPSDDVIDRILNQLSVGALPGDNVNANDVPLLSSFPFLALPHAATESVPRRN